MSMHPYCVGAMKVLVPVRGLILSQRAEAVLAVAAAGPAARSIVWRRCPFNMRRLWQQLGALWVVDRLQGTTQRVLFVGYVGVKARQPVNAANLKGLSRRGRRCASS